jgi:O-acetyl-ADP-ribose deacetylase (regulator of RNase III)
MLKTVTGDILLSGAKAIAHGIAPNDHFASGLALQLRELYPALAKDFRHWFHTAHPKTGEVWAWASPKGVRVYNLLTQEPAPSEKSLPGKARIEHVNHALRYLREVVQSEKIASLALPRIATGHGGLEWSSVEPLIQQHLGNIGIPVYVYAHYTKGQKAAE